MMRLDAGLVQVGCGNAQETEYSCMDEGTNDLRP